MSGEGSRPCSARPPACAPAKPEALRGTRVRPLCEEVLRSRYGGVETMRAVVDRLQGPAPQPPGRVALGGRLRLGTGPARRGAPVPDVAQPLAGICGPEGDQLQTPDVTGESNLHMMGGWVDLNPPAPSPSPQAMSFFFFSSPHCMHCFASLGFHALP